MFSLHFGDDFVFTVVVTIQTLFHLNIKQKYFIVSVAGIHWPGPAITLMLFLSLSCKSLSTIATTPQDVDSPHSSNVALPVIHRRHISAANSAGFLFLHNSLPKTWQLKPLPLMIGQFIGWQSRCAILVRLWSGGLGKNTLLCSIRLSTGLCSSVVGLRSLLLG